MLDHGPLTGRCFWVSQPCLSHAGRGSQSNGSDSAKVSSREISFALNPEMENSLVS